MDQLIKISILLVGLLFPSTVLAQDFELDGIFYNINGNDAIVTYQGTEQWSHYTYSGDVTIPATVTYLGTTYTVTAIGDYAFCGCGSLTSITIPYSVTSIGDFAFPYCIGLTSIDIPKSVTAIGTSAFYYCIGLTSIDIPNSVATIGDEAFADCSGLTSVTLGSSVTTIGQFAFTSCSGLESISIPSSVTTIGDNPFRDCNSLKNITVENGNTHYDSRNGCNAIIETEYNKLISSCLNTIIPNTVMIIGNYAFYSSQVMNVTIPNSVTNIGNCAFSYSRLTNVTIPNSVTTISESAFRGCYGLSNISVSSDNMKYDSRQECNAIIETATHTLIIGCKSSFIPNTVVSIGDKAFADCSGLTSVTIPNSVTSIGNYSFSHCVSLTSATFPNSVTSIGDYAFWDAGLTSVIIPNSLTSFGESAFQECHYLTSATIGDSVTHISKWAFENCDQLTDLIIGNSVTTIDGAAFWGCSSLTTVEIPASVTTIGSGAFGYCDNLNCVTIPNSVTNIVWTPFFECNRLTNVYCYINDPTKIVMGGPISGGRGSIDYSGRTLHVPAGTLTVYQADRNWFPYFGNIVEMEPQERFYIEDFEIAAGESHTVSIILENNTAYTAFQTDIYLPDGLTVEQEDGDYIFDLTTRKSRDHIIASQLQVDGAIRVMSYSPRINAYSGNSGSLVTFNVTASANVVGPVFIILKNTLYTTITGAEVPFNDETCKVTVTITDIKGDVNGDGQVSISDVSSLIDLLLTGDTTIEDSPGADVNLDGIISIADVSELIDLLLTGN